MICFILNLHDCIFGKMSMHLLIMYSDKFAHVQKMSRLMGISRESNGKGGRAMQTRAPLLASCVCTRMLSPAPRTEASWSDDTPSGESSPGRARILLLSPHSFVSPRRTQQHYSNSTPKRSLRTAAKFDIVSYLPSEIAVSIFHLLPPADLCK